MEPKLPAPNLGPEYPRPNYERKPEAASSLATPENNIERKVERFEQRSEALPGAAVAQPILPPPVTAPIPPNAVVVATDDTATSDNPLVAKDDDLIEKEWVDKAKQIVIQTKDDPYRREEEVSKLQADYLFKRYGKEIGTPQ